MLEKLSTSQRKIVNWLGFLLIVGIGFMLIKPEPANKIDYQPQATTLARYEQTTTPNYAEQMEQELKSILQKIQGVGSVEVFVTLERGSRIRVAETVTDDLRTIEEYQGAGVTRTTHEQRQTSAPVTLRLDAERKEVPLVLEEYEPIVRGVLVVAEGVADPHIRYQVAKAVQTVLQIPMYRIEVLPKVN